MSTLTIGLRRWAGPMFLAIFGLTLAACQFGQSLDVQRVGQPWQVVESIGEARIERHDLLYAKGLRAGDRIADNSRVVTGENTQLIMARKDLQFTANGNTTIILPKRGSSEVLSHRFGDLSVRLASSADDEKRIVTPHLMTSGSSASFNLQVDDQGTSISMKNGSAAISTSDGRHFVTLTAGASARLGRETDGKLEIQPAAGLPFQPSPKLEAVPTSVEQPPSTVMAKAVTKPHQASRSPQQPQEPVEAVVLPAKVIVEGTETCGDGVSCRPHTADMSRNRNEGEVMHPPRHVRGNEAQPSLVPASSVELSTPKSQTTTLRPVLNHQFNGLTDGLLDGLPSEPHR